MESVSASAKKVVVISGYFNPPHEGHMEYARMAKEFAGEDGYLYCIVNSDQQAILKKRFSFMPERDRVSIMGSLKYVDKAVLSIDTDRTVRKTIQMICDAWSPKPTHFANGGDVTEGKSPEDDVCALNDIEMVFGLGDKIQSSSWILDKSVKEAYDILIKKE